MRTTRKVNVPAATRTVTDKITCDLCGNEMDENGHIDEDGRYDEYTIEAVTVSYETGTCYPEDGHNTETELFDICPTCYKTKLVIWLKGQGATPRMQ